MKRVCYFLTKQEYENFEDGKLNMNIPFVKINKKGAVMNAYKAYCSNKYNHKNDYIYIVLKPFKRRLCIDNIDFSMFISDLVRAFTEF